MVNMDPCQKCGTPCVCRCPACFCVLSPEQMAYLRSAVFEPEATIDTETDPEPVGTEIEP